MLSETRLTNTVQYCVQFQDQLFEVWSSICIRLRNDNHSAHVKPIGVCLHLADAPRYKKKRGIRTCRCLCYSTVVCTVHSKYTSSWGFWTGWQHWDFKERVATNLVASIWRTIPVQWLHQFQQSMQLQTACKTSTVWPKHAYQAYFGHWVCTASRSAFTSLHTRIEWTMCLFCSK